MFKQTYLSILLALAMVVSTISGGSVNIAFAADAIEIQILGTSDLHGRFDTFNYANNTRNINGSLTQLSEKIKELRKKNPNTILVDAGDTLQDNMANIFLEDELHPMFAAMNEMQYDSWTIGNHEFNYGKEVLESVIQQPTMPVLCGNVYKEDGTRLGQAYTIKEVGGIRVAIIGMTTPNIMKWDGSKLTGYTVTNPIEETQKAIEEIKKNKAADLFIASVHMGLNSEYVDEDSAANLAKACPELSAIICGHAHQTIASERAGNAIISEPGKFGENLSQITLKVKLDENGFYKVVESDSNVISMAGKPVDKELDKMLQPYHNKAVAYGEEIIGELVGGSLVPEDEIPGVIQAQVQDTALMHLYHDAMSYYTEEYIPEDARLVTSIAILDANSNLSEGSIKRSDMVKIYKYENTIYTMKINGEMLRKYMEWSASYFNQYKDGDLTISFNPDMALYLYDVFGGVNYKIDISQPVGSRIKDLTYDDGVEVKDNDEIYLSVNDYRSSSRLLSDLFKDDDVEIIHKTDDDAIYMFRDLIALYISDIMGGIITNDFTPNWGIVGTNFNESKVEQLKEAIASGEFSLKTDNTGKNPNSVSITEKDLQNNISIAQ